MAQGEKTSVWTEVYNPTPVGVQRAQGTRPLGTVPIFKVTRDPVN